MQASISASRSSLLFSSFFPPPPPPRDPPRPGFPPRPPPPPPPRPPEDLKGLFLGPGLFLTPPPMGRLTSMLDSTPAPAISILIGRPSRGTPLYCFRAFMASPLLSKVTSAVPRLLPLLS